MATISPAPPGGVSRTGGTARRVVGMSAGLLLLALALFASIMFGSRTTSFGDVVDVLSGTADAQLTAVVESRYPRTALGVLAGLALAVAGTLMQGVSRNALAEPGLLGINAGASASIVTATAFLGASGGTATMWWALPGALLAGVLVLAIGSGGSGRSQVRLVLAGAVLSAVLMAFIQAVTLTRPQVFDSYRYWVVGALGGRDFEVFRAMLPFACAGLVLALLLARGLNALALGDATAAALGARPWLVRSGGLLAATLLSASATAAVGPIAFVGLAVPHVVRAVVGVDFHRQILFSCVAGPALLLIADVVGRIVLRPQELMVGVVTAFVGAPALLVAVRRMRGNA
ncbi:MULTISPECIES: FecCD family ABC transporter permease [Streptomyces]|uniref:Iron ABC transporter permease n=1 Tax=Streptomyces tsukubensis (strain DSM 42081 / NBRC 108919 / NRRL 18488 / 9993) TaxID=1114943 RepID=I2NBM5_STRT9|nr:MULTISPECIES: iron chelate uptake ABC transporter family permease subunit [Streptomyces]AZK98134.1 iron ABC transporter permease [Streptomyces tsukubensis]EIF94422.1 iron ABC transporter [Streptomyces tsukubensis NRRL18488]MYS63350.1 iron chelate uptake ABC transporter family permease subunit [Streptomyces sp. SID5473]QKM65943.1 iron ABC transporter permease [Streptomyces tsukubensis NRRL18488]TAI42229.1 iron ABC transporter permease [Streptomyces tsukubensis]